MLTYLLWLFVKGIFYSLLLILLLYAGREYFAYQNLQYFKKQGVKCYYTPVIGFLFFWLKPKGDNDSMTKLRKLLEENKDEPLIMFNTQKMTKSTGFLLDDELIRDLATKEFDNTIKIEFMKDSHLGFFFQNGEKLLNARAAYARFFNFDNLKILTSNAASLTNKVFADFAIELRQAQLCKDNGKAGLNGWTPLLLNDFLNKAFCQVVNSILFGEVEKNFLNGVDLSFVIQHHVNSIFKINMIPHNTLSLDYLHEWSILPETRKLQKEYAELRDKCWSLYQNRIVAGPKKDPNLLDLLITRNRELVEQGKPGLTKDEVVGDFLVLQFAGADTSLEISCASIMQLRKLPDHQRIFQGFCDQAFKNKSEEEGLDYQDTERDELFEQYILEFLRTGSPIPSTAPREFIKPTKLGKYHFRAGDRILVPSNLNHTWSKYWEDPNRFDPSRMSKENLKSCKKSAFMPFGYGRRICVGKALGEIMVKVMLLTFFRYFEVQDDNHYTEVRLNKLSYGYENPALLVRPRTT